MYTILYATYKVLSLISRGLAYTIRYLIYRYVVTRSEDLVLLRDSEFAYIDALKLNKKAKIKRKWRKGKKIKIGIVGSLSNSLIFGNRFWQVVPANIELYLYDLVPRGYESNLMLVKSFNYKKIEATYYSNSIFKRVYADRFDYLRLAEEINSVDLDALIIRIETIGGYTYTKLLNEITTDVNIIALNSTNFFYPHPKIKVQGQIQLPPCWKVIDNVLVSSKGDRINDFIFVKDLAFYDLRDIDIDFNFNRNFENIIFYHGRLSKLCYKDFLEIISFLLEEDDQRFFVFMGFDDNNSLFKILRFFKRKGQLGRIRYMGFFSQKRDQWGRIKDKNWQVCKWYLKHSGVFLNPFPEGAGSARMEAFASGLPVIDFEIDYVSCRNRKKKKYVLESLMKKHGTAFSREEYIEYAIRVFRDMEFRMKIVEEQFEIVRNFCSEEKFWERILRVVSEIG